MVDKRRFDTVQLQPHVPLPAHFVKTRRVVRLTCPDGTSTELPVGELLERLGIDLADLVPPRHFIVFAGGEEPLGGSGDIAGTFTNEDDARALFQRLRTSTTHTWAQLVALDARGRTRAICWFGRAFQRTAVGGDRPLAARRRPHRLSLVPGGDGEWIATVS